ncbi:hypothetical protein P23p79 [Thermus phage P23-45]|uniref:Uncharacterized protein n=1 Tax=Thermus virus P23-45 TaxID=2914006 RepID=A7XXB1_BP234|nr:hypothetical protein P23p79 [Thermus phage P23-45]ABU96912.1 hypothetical protein P23p79 [Thermus phage P23-45]
MTKIAYFLADLTSFCGKIHVFKILAFAMMDLYL